MSADNSFADFWDGMYRNGAYLDLWEEQQVDPQVAALLDSLALVPGSRVLDLGCGSGLELCAMAQRGWITSGIDISPTAIELARQRCAIVRPAPELLCGSVLALPWPDASFDLLTDRGCLHLIPHARWQRYAAEARRVLRPAGRLLLRGCCDCSNPDFNCLSMPHLAQLLLPAGFSISSSCQARLANRRGGLPAMLTLLESANA